jgi:hypothetical protein
MSKYEVQNKMEKKWWCTVWGVGYSIWFKFKMKDRVQENCYLEYVFEQIKEDFQ